MDKRGEINMPKEVLFPNYKKQILDLPLEIEKEHIINDTFKMSEEGKLSVYYAPHNEYHNAAAKIVIVGICPGWTQTKEAYIEAKKCLENNLELSTILKRCKMNARFAGSMRNNIINMLDELELPKYLSISCISSLFEDNILLHTTSLIPYPVFINGKNYTGHTPSIIESNMLMSYVKSHFYEEIKLMDNPLIIPLGKSVEEVLSIMIQDKVITKEQCLFGFPHPSGANGHRKTQFRENKEELKNQLNIFFNN